MRGGRRRTPAAIPPVGRRFLEGPCLEFSAAPSIRRSVINKSALACLAAMTIAGAAIAQSSGSGSGGPSSSGMGPTSGSGSGMDPTVGLSSGSHRGHSGTRGHGKRGRSSNSGSGSSANGSSSTTGAPQ
jgi:hypothetical protein